MAELIDGLPGKPRRVYPWDEWADGKPRLLVRGVDYYVNDHSMYTAASAHARAHGMTLQTRRTQRGIAVQFFPAKKRRLRRKGE